jgi:metal-dependent amidase/aminoacylase/carboxypeptidase family protein
VRSFKPTTRELLQTRMKQLTAGICAGNDCEFEWWYDHRFPPTINSTEETKAAGTAAAGFLGDANFNSDVDPSTGSEDFGYMLEEKPGCYIFIGNGSSDGGCLLHNPHYDFNDDIIPIGASYWVELVEQELTAGRGL